MFLGNTNNLQEKKLFSSTISSSKQPFHETLQSTIFDTPERVNQSVLKKNIEIIAEFLARIIYNIEDDVQIFRDDLAVDERYFSSLLNTISEYNRMMPFLMVDNDKKLIIEGFEKELNRFVGDLVVQKGELKSETIYYDKLKLEMYAYRAKPLIFDIILSLAILCYCGILYISIKGPKETWNQFIKFFKR